MSASLLGWIITIFFVLVLTAGFFIGFWRGLKRSTVSVVISIVGVIVAFFVTPAITNAILGINITVDGTQTTLQGAIVNAFREDPDINAMMLANENLEVFFNNLPKALVNVVLFILVTVLVELFLYVVYKILAVTVFKIKEDENKHKLSGGFVGLAKTFVIMILAFMPLSSLVSTANNLMTTQDYGITSAEQTSILEDKLPEGSKDIISGIENNLLIKCCGIFGINNAMFDYYSNFELDGETLCVREEVDNVYKIVDFGYQLANTDLNEVNYVLIRYDKLAIAIEDTTNSTLFQKVVSQTLADLVINYEEYSFIADAVLSSEFKEVFDNVGKHLEELEAIDESYKYFQNDLLKVVSAVKVLGQSGIINDILALESTTPENIANILTNEDNEESFKSAIQSLMDVNIVRDGLVTFAQKGLDLVTDEFDEIGVSTNGWTENDWDDFTLSLTNIIDCFGDISNEVDLFEVLEDATILLDEQKNYDINLITTKLGGLLDELRSNKLLKNAEEKPIVDGLLNKNNISLPENDVIDHNGNYKVTIDSYTDYFNFIKGSLIKMRDKGVYKTVNDTSLSSKQMIIKLAEIISATGNEGLLSDIILPLYQVEPTKTIIVDKLSSSLQSDLINFATLSTYEDWASDLNYLSNMLITLNNITDGTNTFLSVALDGNLDAVVENLNEISVDSVLKPILYAKSTQAVKEKLFSSIKSQLDNASGANSTLSLDGVTLKEGDNEDQVTEICNIVKKLIVVDSALDGGETLKTMDKATLGILLNTMKENAYRVELHSKTQAGIFKNAFIDLVNKFKLDYKQEVNYIENNEELLIELEVSNLGEENYKNINYVKLLSKIGELESLM